MLKLKITIFSAVFLLAFTSCAKTNSDVVKIVNDTFSQKDVLSVSKASAAQNQYKGMDLVGNKSNLALYLNRENCQFILLDLKNQAEWYSNPIISTEDKSISAGEKNLLMSQLILSTVNEDTNSVKKKNSYIASVKNHNFTIEQISDGIKIIYNFKDDGYIIPVTFRLLNDSLYVEILTKDIIETGTEKIEEISVLPFFGAGDKQSKGYMLMPDGSGSIINFNNKKSSYAPYNVRIFDQDETFLPNYKKNIQQPVMMPVYGIWRENSGLVAIAEQGASYAYANASVSGQNTSYNNAYFSFLTRQQQISVIGDKSSASSKEVVVYESGKIKEKCFGIRYFVADKSENGYISIADVVRAYLLNQLNIKENIPEKAPIYLNIKGETLTQKSVLGIPIKVEVPLTTFKEAKSIVNELSQNGVSNIQVIYTDYMRDQLEKKIITKLKPAEILGGNKEFQDFESALKQADGKLFLSVDNVLFQKSANGYGRSQSVSKDLSKSPADVYYYDKDTNYIDKEVPTSRLLKPVFVAEAIGKFVKSVQNYNSEFGIYFNQLGSTLYSDYSNNVYERESVKNIFAKALEETAVKTNIVTQSGNFYTLNGLSGITNVSEESSNFDIEDASIPFYQIVMHGILPYTSTPINTSGDYTDAFLKSIETGSLLSFELINEQPANIKKLELESYFSASYNEIKSSIISTYKKISNIYDLTSKETVKDYKQIDGKITVITYANDISVIINYSNDPETYKNNMISPKSYIIMKGEQVIES